MRLSVVWQKWYACPEIGYRRPNFKEAIVWCTPSMVAPLKRSKFQGRISGVGPTFAHQKGQMGFG